MRGYFLAAAAALIAVTGCKSSVDPPAADVAPGPSNLRIGEACEETKECDYNLLCVSNQCTMVDDKPVNTPCIASGECQPGLYCSLAGFCTEAGEGVEGDPCTTGAECTKEHYCASLGANGYCAAAGPGDVGAACSSNGDCLGGLNCDDEGICARSNLNFGLLPWLGVGPTTCEQTSDDGPIRFYFEIPRDDVTEFFRLPYPSDIRVRNNRVSLVGFPKPGKGLIGFDPVTRIADAIEDGGHPSFSLNPAVYFRFSGGIQFDSLKAGGDNATVHFVNIDPDSPRYKNGQSYAYNVTDGGTKYICPRYLVVQSSFKRPLEPNTTYAVFLTTGVQDKNGNLMGPDSDLSIMLSGTRPANATEGAAWDAMQPLRDYLAEEDTKASSEIIGAAVFTTHDVSSTYTQLREAVQTVDQGEPVDLTLCDGANVSPCDDGTDERRACPTTVNPAVHELHMKVRVPVAQNGTRPYLEPGDGGDLKRNAGNMPTLSETEEVCVSLTIPKTQAMPPNGWPVMLYGHGTGGTYRSAVESAGIVLAQVETDDTQGGTVNVGAAVVGWDGVMHGPRRGGSDIDPGTLFFNFANPLAARGNLYQGAVDVFALTKFFKGLVVDAATSPTGEEIRFDPALIGQTGHSQGSTTGPLASPYEPDIKINVWSGAGGGLLMSLLNKTSPVDVPSGVAIALSEINDQGLIAVNDRHPVLRLVQQHFDVVDPLNHARFAFRTVAEGQEPQDTLLIYGVNDTFTPAETTEAFADVLGLDHVSPAVVEEFGPALVDPPVSANKRSGEVTAGVVVHAPDGYDGHYVLFQNTSAIKQYQQFVASWIVSGTPTIVAP